jgi:hypothetical protein
MDGAVCCFAKIRLLDIWFWRRCKGENTAWTNCCSAVIGAGGTEQTVKITQAPMHMNGIKNHLKEEFWLAKRNQFTDLLMNRRWSELFWKLRLKGFMHVNTFYYLHSQWINKITICSSSTLSTIKEKEIPIKRIGMDVILKEDYSAHRTGNSNLWRKVFRASGR